MSTNKHANALASLGGFQRSSFEMIVPMRQGYPASRLEAVAKALGMSTADVGAHLGIPSRTLARRLQTKGLFTSEESQRVHRLERALTAAKEALGTLEKARRWLQNPSRALGGEVPLKLLDTDVGAEAVLEEIGRIEYGVFA